MKALLYLISRIRLNIFCERLGFKMFFKPREIYDYRFSVKRTLDIQAPEKKKI